MEKDRSGIREARQPVFHVARAPLPIGHALRPYALGRDCRDAIRSLAQARADGLGAVAQLVAKEAWPGCVPSGRYPVQMVLLEAAFEWVRAEVAPALPSRLDAVFAWETAALARRYCDSYQPGGTIHRCQVVAGRQVTRDGALVVAADETADLAGPSVGDLLRLERHAARYWRAEDSMTFPELLVQGTVVVDAIIGDASGM